MIKDIHKSGLEIKANLTQIEQSLPEIIAYYKVVMQVRRSAYDEALRQGFNEQQALELAKAVM